MRTVLSCVVGFALALVAPTALAQGENQGGAGGTAGGTAGAGATVEPPKVAVKAAAPEPAKEEDNTTDHEKFVGHFAIGYLGLTNLPLGGGGNATGVTQTTLPAPVIGGRYWLNKLIGIDAGVGFALASSSNEVQQNNTTTTSDGPSILGLAFHAGVPLALATGKHYTFEVIPEGNIGFTSQTVHSPPGPNPPPDIHHSGFRLDIGARAGAEVHFGFIGVPELALQATIGLYFQRQVWHSSQDQGNPTPTSSLSSSISQTGLGTSVQSDPWALFVNNIAALYYF
jgi:hypothetical protein